MRINKFVAIASCLTLFYSCSSVRFVKKNSTVVAIEQPASLTNTTPTIGETRTLFIKSDVKEKAVVLVAGCVLKDSTSLSAFTVIVGSFTQPTSAVALINKLKQKSITPYFVRNAKGLYRLVTGTFENKDDADFQVLKLDVSDIDAWVLAR